MSLQLLLQGIAIGVVNGALYALTALGLTLVYGILHIVNFAHGEIYMLGAFMVFVLFVLLQWPLAFVLLAIVALAALAGFAVERGVFRRLRGQWMQLLVASVGISLIIQSLSWIAFGAQEKNVPSVLSGVMVLGGVRQLGSHSRWWLACTGSSTAPGPVWPCGRSKKTTRPPACLA